MLYFDKIITGFRLTEHVVKEMNPFGVLECAMYCLNETTGCKSINFKTNHQQKNCQLVNETKITHPQILIVDMNYDHYEMMTLQKVLLTLGIPVYISINCSIPFRASMRFNFNIHASLVINILRTYNYGQSCT